MKKNILARFISLILILFGLILIANAAFPILTYEINSFFKFQKAELLSPQSYIAAQVYPVNLTQASTWFEGSPDLPPVISKVQYYNLSLPSLKIANAVVEIGGNDLSRNLIHFKGTALPGREGNAVIFGHSSLPQFFSPGNYLSIFAKLPTLKKGDLAIVDYDGIVYTFRVEEMFEVKPTDIQVLEQRFDNSYLTLVTCVPPGTYLKRLVVKARLVPSN